MPGIIVWQDPGRLVDGDLSLILADRIPADPDKGYVPVYVFEMRRLNDHEYMGSIELRIGNTFDLKMYAGHIAYEVEPRHRGHHYAARGCGLLFPLARSHGLHELWITCNPDNWPSRRTCELAGGRLVEIVDLPEDNDMYREGERQKCRYRFEI